MAWHPAEADTSAFAAQCPEEIHDMANERVVSIFAFNCLQARHWVRVDHDIVLYRIHVPMIVKGKVKSLFWVHIQAQSSALQTLTSTFPGHWAFTVHISIWISIPTPWGVYSRSHATWRHGLQICPHRYPFPTGSREAMQREVSCSGAQRAVAPAGYWTRDLTRSYSRVPSSALYRWTNSPLSSVPIWLLLLQQQKWYCYLGVFWTAGGKSSHHSGNGGWWPLLPPLSRQS